MATPTTTLDRPPTTTARPLAPLTRLARLVYTLGAGLFAACIVVQVFFAGLAVLVSPAYWGLHLAFGPLIGYLPLGLLVVGLVGRLPARLLGLTALLVLLFVMQFMFLHTLPQLGVVELRALHAVNALALFWGATHLTRRAVGLARAPVHAR